MPHHGQQRVSCGGVADLQPPLFCGHSVGIHKLTNTAQAKAHSRLQAYGSPVTAHTKKTSFAWAAVCALQVATPYQQGPQCLLRAGNDDLECASIKWRRGVWRGRNKHKVDV